MRTRSKRTGFALLWGGCEEEAGHGFVGPCKAVGVVGDPGGGVLPRVGGLLLGW